MRSLFDRATMPRRAAIQTITYLHQRKMDVVCGRIVGNPGNTHESIEVNLEFARQYVDLGKGR